MRSYAAQKKLNIQPYIFTKKANTSFKLTPFKWMVNDMNKTKYLPPVIKEWKNSVYNYNSNTTMNYPVHDLNLNSLIRGYFSMYFNREILAGRFITVKKRRNSLNKIFVSKAEVKHTNSKAIITIYVYNREEIVLLNKLNEFRSYIEFLLKESEEKKFITNIIINPSTQVQYPGSGSMGTQNVPYSASCEAAAGPQKKIMEETNTLLNLTNYGIRLMKGDLKERKLNIKISGMLGKYLQQKRMRSNSKSSVAYYLNFILDRYSLKITRILYIIRNLRLRLNLNRNKFEDMFISKLAKGVSRHYGKHVEFNIVNLKSIAHNPDIFTEILTTRIKRENTSPVREMGKLLSYINLPEVNTITERGRVEKYVDENLLEQKYRNNSLSLNLNPDFLDTTLSNSSLFKSDSSQTNDSLNQLLTIIYDNPVNKNDSNHEIDNQERNDSMPVTQEIKIRNSVLENVKYKNPGGARLRVKGRLTRRYRADRAVHKLQWKGGLKNIDSAFKGLSTVVFRGDTDSNVEKSMFISKRRIGSFAVKGWFSAK